MQKNTRLEMQLEDQDELIKKTKNDLNKEWTEKYEALEQLLNDANTSITDKAEKVEKLED